MLKNMIKNQNVKFYIPKEWEDGKKTDLLGSHLKYFTEKAYKNNCSLIFSGGKYYYSNPSSPWDYAFYDNILLDYSSTKYDYFYLKYDKEKAKRSFKELTNGEPYIFIHDDYETGRVINIKNEKKLKIVRNSIKYSVFDYIEVIKNANECHMMGSSLLCLINFFDLNYEKCKYYFYDFRGSNINFKDKEKWNMKETVK